MSIYECECKECGNRCNGTDEEWEMLREKITDRATQSITNKTCKNVPSTWTVIAKSKNLILWQEG